MLKLNPQYKEKVIWNPNKEIAKGVFARYWSNEKLIEYYPRWQYALIWPIMKYFIQKHERAHSWGITNCLSNSKTCIMYEDNDTWIGKLKLLPIQIFGLGKFCKKCKNYLKEIQS